MIAKRYVILALVFLFIGAGVDTSCEAATSLGRNRRITLTKIGDASADVGVHNLRMKVAVTGDIAEVELTMLIANQGAGVRAGYMRIPVPNDSVATRFAIDVKGGMLDALALDNEVAETVWFREASNSVPGEAEDLPSIQTEVRNRERARGLPVPPMRPSIPASRPEIPGSVGDRRRRRERETERLLRQREDERRRKREEREDERRRKREEREGLKVELEEEVVEVELEDIDRILRRQSGTEEGIPGQILRRNKQTAKNWRNELRRKTGGWVLFEQEHIGGSKRGNLRIRQEYRRINKHTGQIQKKTKVSNHIDPGLLAWDGDNRLRMQIFPIMPELSRCVTITYVTQLVRDGGYARLSIPLSFAGWVRSYDLTIDLDKTAAAPKIDLKGIPTPEFTRERNRLVSRVSAEYVSLPDSFTLSFAKDRWDEQLVQKASDGNVYFALRPANQEVKEPLCSKQISSAAILWDASASEWGKSQESFLKTLSAWLEQPALRDRQIAIDAVPFHISEEKPARFDVSNSKTGALFSYLKSCLHDGATSLKLNFRQKKPDVFLLFTDGRSTCSDSMPKKFSAPVFVFSRSPGANTTLLKQIATKSGGCYFDLSRIRPTAAAQYMSGEILSYKSTHISSGEVNGLTTYPWRHAELGSLAFGQLDSYSAEIELLYGNDTSAGIPFAFTKDDAVEGDQLRALWASRAALADAKHAESIGKKYNIITPKTSMLVMEDIGQYRRNALPFPKRLLALSRPHQIKRSSGARKSRKGRQSDREKPEEVILPKKIKKSELMRAYAEQKQTGHQSATFYLSWAKILIRHSKNNDALRVLSNLRELDLIDNNSYDEILAFQGWASKYKRGRFWYKEEDLLKLLLLPPWYSASAGNSTK